MKDPRSFLATKWNDLAYKIANIAQCCAALRNHTPGEVGDASLDRIAEVTLARVPPRPHRFPFG